MDTTRRRVTADLALGVGRHCARPLPHCHGATIEHDGRTIFRGLSSPLTVGRYHSLVVDPATVPADLEVTATTDDGVVMGLRHRRFPIEGVQFHPESILTSVGHDLLRNFLEAAGATV